VNVGLTPTEAIIAATREAAAMAAWTPG